MGQQSAALALAANGIFNDPLFTDVSVWGYTKKRCPAADDVTRLQAFLSPLTRDA